MRRDEPRFLHGKYDPANGGSLRGWTETELVPGQAALIPAGWWHSLEASAGSIAFSVCVSSTVNLAEQPKLRVFKSPAPTRARRGWSSVKAFVNMWNHCV